MEALRSVKAEDRVERLDSAHNGSFLSLDALPGTWLNTDGTDRGITKVVITVTNSKLVVQVSGAFDPEPCDWGEAEADHLYANNISSGIAAGFTAWCRLDSRETHLQANWNQGLLVLASFTSFKDASKRSNYFAREFFHRAGAVNGSAPQAPKVLHSQERSGSGKPIAPEPLLGTWVNTNTDTRGIARVVLGRSGARTTLRVLANGSAGRQDWGETDAAFFAADPSSAEAMAFSAFYDFGFMETQLQGHVRQGVLIIAKFDRFKDNSGRSNYFSKEFFYRVEA
jgi:hypothetical protein